MDWIYRFDFTHRISAFEWSRNCIKYFFRQRKKVVTMLVAKVTYDINVTEAEINLSICKVLYEKLFDESGLCL